MPTARALPRTRRIRGWAHFLIFAALLAMVTAMLFLRIVVRGWPDHMSAIVGIVISCALGAVAVWGSRALKIRSHEVERLERMYLDADDGLPFGIAREDGRLVGRGRRGMAALFNVFGVLCSLFALLSWFSLEPPDRWIATGIMGGLGLMGLVLGICVRTARVVMDAETITARFGVTKRARWSEVPTVETEDPRRIVLRGQSATVVIPVSVLSASGPDLLHIARSLRGF
ncbi:hypothetical protein [Ruania alba]|uniref:Uncharacterized protein n=1 Tax=Ruania alba TaxID=648782 RepID=A0A1H5KUX1_9MICO|nr:hypothetical protein [Ruania alba]SEE68510.1 hypothetical protein SAMN04488554_2459 [Ruania alba]